MGITKKLDLLFAQDKKHVYIEVDYLLVAIGRISQKDFYTDSLLEKEKSLVDEGRLFLAGDVKNGLYRQVAIAVGDGVKAAMEIYHNAK